MADDKPLFERGGRSALADGAARFDNLARELKSQQVTQSQGASSTAYQPAPVSPDEQWARSFMTQGIGPCLELPKVASIAPAMQMPTINLGTAFDIGATAATKSVSSALGVPSAIGTPLGKQAPRRSWLGRLLRAKSQGV